MAKINFSKAEQAVADALQKRMVEQLMDLADEASEGPTNANTLKDIEMAKQAKERSLTLYALYCDLRRLVRIDSEIYNKVGMRRKALEKLMTDLAHITEKEWQKVMDVKELVDVYMKQLSASYSDEQLLKQQQRKSINQRFNVSDRWIPLE